MLSPSLRMQKKLEYPPGDFPPQNIIENILGWTNPPCKEHRGYFDHTEST